MRMGLVLRPGLALEESLGDAFGAGVEYGLALRLRGAPRIADDARRREILEGFPGVDRARQSRAHAEIGPMRLREPRMVDEFGLQRHHHRGLALAGMHDAVLILEDV